MSETPPDRPPASRKAILGFAVVLILAAGLMLVMTQSSRLLDRGTPAPSFELQGLDGDRVALESLRGKVVVLDFWSTTCPPCVRQMRDLETVHQRYRERDVVVLGINTEGAHPALLRSFVEDRGGVHYQVLLDGALVSEQYQVTALPSLYVIDQEGVIRWARVGYTSFRELEDAVRPLL